MATYLESALRATEEAFGDRLRRGAVREERSRDGTSVSVLPRSVEEVAFLAEVAKRFSVPLVALGAGTAGGAGAEGGSILVRFDLMRGLRIRGNDEMWVRAEAGASWLELEDNLGTRGWGLAVYPTSAPRATVRVLDNATRRRMRSESHQSSHVRKRARTWARFCCGFNTAGATTQRSNSHAAREPKL